MWPAIPVVEAIDTMEMYEGCGLDLMHCFCGALAAQFLFIAPGQAVMKIMKDKDTGRLPLIPYSAMCCNGMIWATYGLLLENPAIWVPNVYVATLLSCYLATWQPCHFVTLRPTLLPCNLAPFLTCNLATLLPCYLATLLPCYLATLQPCCNLMYWFLAAV